MSSYSPAYDSTGFALPGIERLGLLVSGLLFTALLISFQPFFYQSAFTTEQQNSSVNMIGFISLGMVAIASMGMLIPARRLSCLVDIPGFLLIAILLLSAYRTPDPAGTMRSIAFALTGALVCTAVVLLPRNEKEFATAALIGTVAALALSYFGIFFMSDLAIHSGDSLEPQHAGLWRGHFTHKNTTGPVMTVLLFFGIYFFRTGKRFIGIAITIASLVFIVNSGSKTTLGLMVPVIALVALNRLIGWRWATVIGGIMVLIMLFLLSVGTVIWPQLAELTEKLLSDPTFTGRTTLWYAGIEAASQVPWTGYGFDNFWMSPIVSDHLLPFDIEWDYREIVNGHNNYIDMALFVGLPGVMLCIYLFIIRPMWDYLQVPKSISSQRMADLFMMIVLFAAFDSVMESFWFRRADPIWLLNFIGVFGLRAVRRLRYG